jgi:O-antigen/teichoic acid export membrane protein
MTIVSDTRTAGFLERVESVQYLCNVAGSISSRLATLAVLILLPAQLGLHDYGLFALVITLGEIIEMTSSNWFRLLLVRQSIQERTADQAVPTGAAGWRPSFAAIAIGVSILGVIAAAIISPLMADTDSFDLSLAVSIYVVNFAVLRLVLTLLQAENRQGLAGIVECIRGIVMLILVFGLIFAGWKNFYFAAIGFSLASGVAALVATPALFGSMDRLLARQLAPGSFTVIAVPTIIVTILTFQFGWMDRIILQTWLGPSMVGLYVAATAVARQPVDLVLFALNQQAFPVLLSHSGSESRGADRQIAGILIASCILGFGAAGACIALAQPLVDCILPKFDRTIAVALIGPIAIGSVALGIKHVVFDNIFHTYGKNWRLLGYLSIVSIGTLLLSIEMVKRFGPFGAAIAFMIGSVLAVVVAACVSRNIWRFAFPTEALLRILVCTIIAGAATELSLHWLSLQNSWLLLIVGGGIYALTYFASLVLLMSFNIRRFMSAPWEHDILARQHA